MYHKSLLLRARVSMLCCFWLSAVGLFAQFSQVAVPPVLNYTKKQYRAGTQNWGAAQGLDGRMYWANNEGLLCFDGQYWNVYPVSNRTVVRSLAVGDDQKMYVGAQGEFGYFLPDNSGSLHYHSLTHLIEQSITFEDVWDIVIADKMVYFSSSAGIFCYDQKTIKTLRSDKRITSLVKAHTGIYAQTETGNLLKVSLEGFSAETSLPSFQSEVTAALSWSTDTTLITTLKDGIFFLTKTSAGQWRTPHDALLRQNRIYSACLLYDGRLALGTSLAGLYVMDRRGALERQLHAKNGLQYNNILSTYSDASGNLWLGLDSGIDCVVMTSPFTTIIPDTDLKGTGYAAALTGQGLYLGVNNGVYYRSVSADRSTGFKRLNGSDGQVWALRQAGGQLLLGHHEGSYTVQGEQLNQLSQRKGAWTFEPLSNNTLVGGTYDGLSLFQQQAGRWTEVKRIQGLQESCRFVATDTDGSIWVAHPYRGVYRVTNQSGFFDSVQVQFYNSKGGLPSDLNNYVFSVAHKPVFATEQGIYRYQPETDGFGPDTLFNRTLAGSGRIKYLKEDPQGNIWFVGEHETGMLLVQDYGLTKTVRKMVFPELHGRLVSGFEYIYPLDAAHIFFGAEQGFIHYNGDLNQTDTLLKLNLHQVRLLSDSLLFGGYGSATPKETQLAHTQNEIHFTYAAAWFKDPNLVMYRTRLVGLQSDWTPWATNTTSDYTGLPPGQYIFEAQAMLKHGTQSEIVRYRFEILPPWYRSKFVLAALALAISGLLVWYFVRQRKRFEQEKQALYVQHEAERAAQQRAVDETNLALSALQQKQLETELLFKNRELASATMHLVQKGEILQTVQENLNQILEHSTNPAVKKEIQQLLNLLNFDTKLDDDWEQFAFRFDQVHVDFLKRLRDRYPQLSTTDYKLCAYLRMNLTTKEIAPLMNISVRGVEASRYRLRKKLDLPADANLVDIMLAV